MSEVYKNEFIAGSARIKEFDNGGHVINVSMKKSELAKLPVNKAKNGDEYVAFSLSSKREVDDYGNSHAIKISYKEGEEPAAVKKEESSEDGW